MIRTMRDVAIGILCAVWLAVLGYLLTACGSAPTLPALEVTDAHVQGSAHVAGTMGPVPWSIDAEGDEGGGKVCVTVWVLTRCTEVAP